MYSKNNMHVWSVCVRVRARKMVCFLTAGVEFKGRSMFYSCKPVSTFYLSCLLPQPLRIIQANYLPHLHSDSTVPVSAQPRPEGILNIHPKIMK